MEKRRFVTVARFSDLNTAQVCASALRARGMQVYLPGENLSALFYPANMITGCTLRLQVHAEDADEARALVEQSEAGGVELVEGADEDEAPEEAREEENIEAVDDDAQATREDAAEAEPAGDAGSLRMLVWALVILLLAAVIYALS